MMAEVRDWPTGLELMDGPEGLMVTQHGRTYKGRRWRLTDQLVTIIEAAIAHGLVANWVHGHPSNQYLKGGRLFDEGSHHITFARSHDEGWIFVVGAEAKPPAVEVVTFNKHYWSHIHRAGFPYRWEHAGGHNVSITPGLLREVLASLDKAVIDEVEDARKTRRKTRRSILPRAGIVGESDVELAFLELLSQEGNTKLLRQPLVRQRINEKIPDVLMDMKNGPLVVVELKFSHASHAELDQIKEYLELPGVRSMANGRPVVGILIAASFGEDVCRQDLGSISFYRYGYIDRLKLELIAGPHTLEDLGVSEL